MKDVRTNIVDAAEHLIRDGGYNGFSLEEIASELKLELFQVHEFFPVKGDLALAVAIRYTFNFLTALGEPSPSDSSPEDQLRLYCGVFQKAFEDSGQACLCGVLSKDVEIMPEKVKNAVIDFVEANIDWLTKALSGTTGLTSEEELKESAQCIYCSLQGALTAAALTKDSSWIESAKSSAISRFFETTNS